MTKWIDRISGAWAVLVGKAFAKYYEPDGSHMGSLFDHISRDRLTSRLTEKI